MDFQEEDFQTSADENDFSTASAAESQNSQLVEAYPNRPHLAQLEAANGIQLSQEVKMALHEKILHRMNEAGQSSVETDFSKTVPCQLTPVEEAKREQRRAQNRMASHNYREKKKAKNDHLKRLVSETIKENQRLVSENRNLRQSLGALYDECNRHADCGLQPSTSYQQRVLPEHHQHQRQHQQHQRQQLLQQDNQQQHLELQQQQYQHQSQRLWTTHVVPEIISDFNPSPHLLSPCRGSEEQGLLESQDQGLLVSDMALQDTSGMADNDNGFFWDQFSMGAESATLVDQRSQTSTALDSIHPFLSMVSPVGQYFALNVYGQTSAQLTAVNTSDQISAHLSAVNTSGQTSAQLTAVNTSGQISAHHTAVNTSCQTSAQLTAVNTSDQISAHLSAVNTSGQTSTQLTAVNTSGQTSAHLTTVNTSCQTSAQLTAVNTSDQISAHLSAVNTSGQTSAQLTAVNTSGQISAQPATLNTSIQPTFAPWVEDALDPTNFPETSQSSNACIPLPPSPGSRRVVPGSEEFPAAPGPESMYGQSDEADDFLENILQEEQLDTDIAPTSLFDYLGFCQQ